MANDNIKMWTELNIDLKSHDIILSALGPIFQEVYLSQKNRPAGMGFYDFVVGDIGDIEGVGGAVLIRRHVVLDVAHGQPKELVHRSHPLAVAFGEIIVDGHDMDAARG